MAFERFVYSYLELRLKSHGATLGMQRYRHQLMSVAAGCAHHPQRGFCVAKIDQAYRSGATAFCRDSGGDDKHLRVRPDWDIGSELLMEVLGSGAATCPRCGHSGHES